MKTQHLFKVIMFLFAMGTVESAVAQGNEFSISGECYNSIIGGAAFDGTEYLVGLVGDLTDDSSVTVQFVSADGQLSGNRISLGEKGSAPVVAFDGTNYLVIWADRYVAFLDDGEDAGITNIYGRFISTSGTFAGNKFTIAENAFIKGCTPGAVHFNGANYFFIYKEDDGNNSVGPEYGRFIAKNGTLLGNPIQITAYPAQDIAIAFDGSSYLTAFNVDSKYIYGQFISANGTLAGSSFLIDDSENYSDDPLSVAYGDGKYLVVFPDDSKPGLNENPEWNLFGRFVSPFGIVDSHKITICSASQNPMVPNIAFDGANYLATWISLSEQQVKGSFFNPNGEPQDADHIIFDSVTGTMSLGGVSLFSGGKYLAVCTRVNWPTGVSSKMAEGTTEKSAHTNTNNGIYGKFVEQQTAVVTLNDNADLLKIFPNPATQTITANVANGQMNIYKISGELVRSERINKTGHQVFVGNLPSGIYIVESKTSQYFGRQKLIIRR